MQLSSSPHPASDFHSFVAVDRGISPDEADRLIQEWLTMYRPQARPPIQILARSRAALTHDE